jgi:hypothetical protein
MIAHQREQLERQLQFDREQLAENRRQFEANFGEQKRQFGLEFGEKQRQFDIGAQQQYLGTAVDISGRDPLRGAAYLLGDRSGTTPIEGALRAFKPAGIRLAAHGAERPRGTYVVGEGERGEGLRAGTAELMETDRQGRVMRITPLTGAYAGGYNGFQPLGVSMAASPAAWKPDPSQMPNPIPGEIGPYIGELGKAPWAQTSDNPVTEFWREMARDAYNARYWDVNPNTWGRVNAWKEPVIAPGGLPGFGYADVDADREAFWKEVLDRAEARLKDDPRDATAIAARNNALRNQAVVQTRDTLLRGLYGSVPPAAGSLNVPPAGYGPEAAQEYKSATESAIDPLWGVAIPTPESQAARFYRLPPDVQNVILSGYGLRNLNAQEVQRRIREVTPTGLRAGTRFGYG